MILLPSRGRPNNLLRFAAAYNQTGATLPVTVLLDDDDVANYDDAWPLLPYSWQIDISPRTYLVPRLNKFFYERPNEPFYAVLADDVVPETRNWDLILMKACMPDMMSYGKEGIDRMESHGVESMPHPFIGGDLVRKWGFIAPPVLNHFYADNWWIDASIHAYMPGVKMTHYHYKNKKAPIDRTYQDRPDPNKDRLAYLEFRKENQHLLMEKT